MPPGAAFGEDRKQGVSKNDPALLALIFIRFSLALAWWMMARRW